MRKAFVVSLVPVAAAAFGLYVYAADTGAAAGKGAVETPSGGQMQPMTDEEMMKQHAEMMKKMGMSEEMMTRCKVIMSAKLDAGDPAVVLALKDDLKLSVEQTAKIEAVAAKAKLDTLAALTEEQKERLGALSSTPDTMISMCREMMQKMAQQKGAQAGMTCPMCQMMQQMSGQPQGEQGAMTCPLMKQMGGAAAGSQDKKAEEKPEPAK